MLHPSHSDGNFVGIFGNSLDIFMTSTVFLVFDVQL